MFLPPTTWGLDFPTTFEPFDVRIPPWQAFQSLAGLLKSEKSPHQRHWTELKAHRCGVAWLPEGNGENHSKLFRCCCLSVLPIPLCQAPFFLFLGRTFGNQVGGFPNLQFFLMKATSSQPHLGGSTDSLSETHSQLLILLQEAVRRINVMLQV